MDPKPAKRRFSSMNSESIEHQRIADIQAVETAASPGEKTQELDSAWFNTFLDEGHKILSRPPRSSSNTIKITLESENLLREWYKDILVKFCVVNGTPLEDIVADPESPIVDLVADLVPGVDVLELYRGDIDSSRISSLDYFDVEPLDPSTTVKDLGSDRVVIAQFKATGTVGLANLGNSCYMNSSLQCLVHIPELVEYFVSDHHSKDINTDNPIGYGGAAAKAFASLVNSLYTAQGSSFSPSQFKTTMGRFNRSFAGYLQQDSQEFTAFLLDALHEDLNRIKQKPATEKPELPQDKISDLKAITDLANTVWDLHKKRNDSIILDLFTGLYKSTLICPVCTQVSITFDPFGDVTLPFPNLTSWVHTIYFMAIDGSKKQFDVALQTHSSVAQLKAQVRQVSGSELDLQVAELHGNKIWQWFNDNDTLGDKIGDDDVVAVYEMGRRSLTVLRQHNQQFFGSPLMLDVDEHDSLEVVRFKLETRLKGIAVDSKSPLPPFKLWKQSRSSRDESMVFIHRMTPLDQTKDEELEVVEVSQSEPGSDPELSSPSSRSEPFELIPTPSPEPQEVDQSTGAPEPLFGDFDVIFCEFESEFSDSEPTEVDNPIAAKVKDRLKSKQSLTLEDCFDIFSTPEVLGENDLWYCSHCKDFRQATKQIELWRCPDIFTIHLKRFRDIHSSRDKINDVVDFPIEGLDMTKRVLGSNGEEYIYDLIAVDNHFGGLGGGHYTAFAKSPISNEWFYFNDSNVTPADPIDSVNGAAYLLFYRRRRENADPPAGQFQRVMDIALDKLRRDMRDNVIEKNKKAAAEAASKPGNDATSPRQFEGEGIRLGTSETAQGIWANTSSFLDKKDEANSDSSSISDMST